MVKKYFTLVGDIIRIKPHHLPPARKIVNFIGPKLDQNNSVYTITVGGESGSGKSTLSLAVEDILKGKGYKSFIFHMDDYFKLPPKDNHDQRLEDISNVGPGEVNLELLQDHLNQCRQGAKLVKKPLVHYRENQIREVIVEMDEVNIIIAEGTYVTLLDDIDCRIFMLRNYLDTYEDRVRRARDPIIPFNEEVLKIEHNIVKKHRKLADILVDSRYEVMPHSEKFKNI